jgi:ATP-binding cassette subfamily F protein 3
METSAPLTTGNKEKRQTEELASFKKELQKYQKQFQQLEEKISKASARKSELEAALSDPATYADKNKFIQAEANYKTAEDELYKLNSQYEQLFEKIIELESQVKGK